MSLQAYRRNLQARMQREIQEREARRQHVMAAALSSFPNALAKFPSIQRAYLFGSVTRAGAFGPQSDLDLAVVGATAEDYFALWAALEEIMPDLVIDVRDIEPGTLFGQRVSRSGVLLYERRDSSPTS